MRRLLVVGAAAGVAVVGLGAVVVGARGPDSSAEAATSAGAVATATVARRDLMLRDDVDGTLGYGEARTLVGSAPGVVTRLPEEGTVVLRGRSLYDVNARSVRLLYGTMPLWRKLAVGAADGQDVEQLERNLVELGHNPSSMTVDETFDTDTAAAVRSWQDALGVPETGVVSAGRCRLPSGSPPYRPGRDVRRRAGAARRRRAPGDRDDARCRHRPRCATAGARSRRRHGAGRASVRPSRARQDRLRREGRRGLDDASGRSRRPDGRRRRPAGRRGEA